MKLAEDFTEDLPRPMGRLGSAYGLKGWMKVQSFTSRPDDLFDYSPWYIRRRGEEWREVRVEDWQVHGAGFIVRLAGTASPEEARLLADSEIGIRRSSLPEPAENEIYLMDLVGCEVIGIGGVKLGKVLRIWDHGAAPVMEVSPSDHLTSGKAAVRLIPYVAGPIVKSVDLQARTISVEWGEDY